MNIKYFKYNALHDNLNQIKGTCISQSSGLVTEVKYKIKYTGNRWNFSDINNIVLVQMFAYLSYCGCFSLHQNVRKPYSELHMLTYVLFLKRFTFAYHFCFKRKTLKTKMQIQYYKVY